MKNEISKLHDYYRIQLAEAALDYLDIGLDVFYEHRLVQGKKFQASIGNLTVALELMLKSFIASKHLTLLFKSLPLEVRVFLTSPETLPENFKWQPFDIDVKSANYTMIELDECISLFYLFFPNSKEYLQPNLRFIARTRNSSVHSFLPKFHGYELERVAYTALKIYEVLEPTELFSPLQKRSSEKDIEFLQDYIDTKLERLHRKVEKAKESSKKRDILSLTLSEPLNHWEYQVISCPICNSDSILYGDTELVEDDAEQEDNASTSYLKFCGDNFECQGCGLLLDDREELKFVGISDIIDRSSEIDAFLTELRRKRTRRFLALGIL